MSGPFPGRVIYMYIYTSPPFSPFPILIVLDSYRFGNVGAFRCKKIELARPLDPRLLALRSYQDSLFSFKPVVDQNIALHASRGAVFI